MEGVTADRPKSGIWKIKLGLLGLLLLGPSGCLQHRIYLGGGGGYAQMFRQTPRERLGVLRLRVQGTPKAGDGFYLGAALDLDTMFNGKGRWLASVGARFGPGYRIGPADFYLLLGTSSYNFDQLDGRFGFGMFSPRAGGGVIFHLSKSVAIGFDADVRYVLRFVPNDSIPVWSAGINLFFWGESRGHRPPRPETPMPH